MVRVLHTSDLQIGKVFRKVARRVVDEGPDTSVLVDDVVLGAAVVAVVPGAALVVGASAAAAESAENSAPSSSTRNCASYRPARWAN